MAANETGGEDLRPTAGIDRLIHKPARLRIMAYPYVIESADFLFLMRQTGLTAGNLPRLRAKSLRSPGTPGVAGGVCRQKATYDAQANRCEEGCFPGGGDASTFVRWLLEPVATLRHICNSVVKLCIV